MTLREQIEALGRLNMATVWLRYDDVLDVVDQHECCEHPDHDDLARLRRIEAAALAAMRAGWFTTNDAGDRAADALRAALEQTDAED